MQLVASFASFALALALAACGSKSPSPAGPGPSDPSDPSAPAPSTPGDDTQPAGGAAAASGGCAQEIAIRCAAGTDGCDDGRTLVHTCVPTGEQAGPPCEQELAKVCPDGQIDACLQSPPAAATHICIYK